MNKNKEGFGEFGYKLHERKAMEKGQFPTPLHIAELMALLPIQMEKGVIWNEKNEIQESSWEWYKDKLVHDPCVGTGNLFWPLKDKGAILIGNDIDLPSLETCKQRIPEAILTNCDVFRCVNPRLVIKDSKKKIVELDEKLQQLLVKEKPDSKEKKRIKDIPLEIEKRVKAIEESKLVKPWKYGLYCSEHTFYEPEETIKRLENKLRRDHEKFMEDVKKFQQEQIQEMRDKFNNGNPIYFNCDRCKTKVLDEEMGVCKCETEIKHYLCKKCTEQSWGTRKDGSLNIDELDISDLREAVEKRQNGK